MSILQWNCNGFHAHLGELQTITNQIQPQIICLQETRLHTHHKSKLNGFTIYRKDRYNPANASGGVAILVHSSLLSQQLNIQTDLEVIAITTFLPNKITVASIYLPPNQPLSQTELTNLIKKLPPPFILAGDFNAHNNIWGSNKIDGRGKIIENIIDEDATLLNDGSPTHLCSRTGSFSCIDLTLCHPRLMPKTRWEVLPYTASDHLPIKITIPDSTPPKTQLTIPKLNLKNPNWPLFSATVKITDNPNLESEDINTVVANFTQLITNSAVEVLVEH